ncbi:MAG: hypothetical protein ACOH17_13705 [Cellulomonas sp.]
MRWWKVLGFAAFAGVAAGGVLIAKDERRRQAYTPDEIRDRLHARLAAVSDADRDANRDGDDRSAQPLP